MGKFLVFIVAGVLGFMAMSALRGGDAGGFADGAGAGHSPQMEGCLRQMRPLVNGESFAQSACTCVYDEFEARGMSLLDAFGSDFDEMSRITRSCAVKYGAQLPPVG